MTHTRTELVRTDRTIDTQISTSGIVTEDELTHAVDTVSGAIADIDQRIGRCVIRLEHGTDRHHVRHAVARLSIDLDGASVHAHADAETVGQAVALAADRLHEQLRRRLDRIADARRHGQSLAEFEASIAGGSPRADVVAFDRGADERELLRRAVFGPPSSTVDEAAFDLDALGYDFHLFVETHSGDAACIRRDLDGVAVRFAAGRPDAAAAIPMDADIGVDPQPAPHLPIDDALELLDLGPDRFVFFLDTASAQPTVVYRRYDGHDGVITIGE